MMFSRKDTIPCLESDFKSGVEPLENCGLVEPLTTAS